MSVPSVPELLRRGAQAPAWVSAVDAVVVSPSAMAAF